MQNSCTLGNVDACLHQPLPPCLANIMHTRQSSGVLATAHLCCWVARLGLGHSAIIAVAHASQRAQFLTIALAAER